MKTKNAIYQTVLTVCLLILGAAILYPILIVFGSSFTSEKHLLANGYKMIPIDPETGKLAFTLSAYKYVFSNPTAIFRAYGVTFAYSVIAMVTSVFFQAMLAYPLAKKGVWGKNLVNFLVFFTMIFSGGLVPEYIVNTQIFGLRNNFWIYILPTMITGWHVFMLRTFFKDIPEAIVESALIDGANEFRIFLTMILPLSKPVLATVAVMTFLSKWNDWYTALIYISDDNLVSLQYLLQRIMKNVELIASMQGSSAASSFEGGIPGETARMAMAVVVAGPALVVFPFFQKYFVKGLTVGSVKG